MFNPGIAASAPTGLWCGWAAAIRSERAGGNLKPPNRVALSRMAPERKRALAMLRC